MGRALPSLFLQIAKRSIDDYARHVVLTAFMHRNYKPKTEKSSANSILIGK